eukprot:2405847-Alexandrium_andersonii.AAC.1
MSASLVGSEMCIRDSLPGGPPSLGPRAAPWGGYRRPRTSPPRKRLRRRTCLLYTSDAADDM